MKGKFIPKSREKMSHTPVKKYLDPNRPEIKFPDPDRPEIKFPDPTRPENILKYVPRPRTGFGPVQSGETRGFGLPRRSLLCISSCSIEKRIVHCRLYTDRIKNKNRIAHSSFWMPLLLETYLLFFLVVPVFVCVTLYWFKCVFTSY